MPRSRLVWLQIADQQHHDLPDVRDVVDRRLARLMEHPTADRDAVYDSHSDQWSVLMLEDRTEVTGQPTAASSL